MDETRSASRRGAWNKGKLVGQKAPFKLQEIWAIRTRLQMQCRLRELALFDLGIDSKLARLRPGQAARPRRVSRRPSGRPGDGASAEDPASGPVRDNPANS